MSVARSSVPPVVAPAPTVAWISSMKRIGSGLASSAAMTALKRSSKSPRKRVPASSAAVSSEKTSAPFEDVRHVVVEQPLGEALGERRLADAGVADEHRVVLAPPAEDLERPLQLDRAADQRIELAGARALGQVDGVGRQRIWRGARRPRRPGARPLRPGRSPGAGGGAGACGTLLTPWEM